MYYRVLNLSVSSITISKRCLAFLLKCDPVPQLTRLVSCFVEYSCNNKITLGTPQIVTCQCINVCLWRPGGGDEPTTQWLPLTTREEIVENGRKNSPARWKELFFEEVYGLIWGFQFDHLKETSTPMFWHRQYSWTADIINCRGQKIQFCILIYNIFVYFKSGQVYKRQMKDES